MIRRVFGFIKGVIGDLINRNNVLSVIVVSNLVSLFCATIFYYVLPTIMNYPPQFVELNMKFGVSYLTKFMMIQIIILLINTILFFYVYKGINKWKYLIGSSSEKNVEMLKLIRKKCINTPYVFYIWQIAIPAAVFVFIFPLVTASGILPAIFIFRIAIAIFAFTSLTAVISLLFLKQILLRVLVKTDYFNSIDGLRVSIKNKVLLQILPMITVAILFTSLIGYSRLIKEKGDLCFEIYKSELTDRFSQVDQVKSLEQVNDILNGIEYRNPNDSSFIILPDNTVITSDNSDLSRVFRLFISDFNDELNGRIYDSTEEIQGAFIKLNGYEGALIVGIKFNVSSKDIIQFFFINFVVLILLNIFILLYFSKSLSDDISLVAEGLTKITEGGNVNFDKRIPVTSNDEISDLVIAFNKIQQLEKEHLDEIKQNQEILTQQERLATLSHMIGGIAHNLKSPIMSIAGGLEGLYYLIDEYKQSIGDNSVTGEDHNEIAKEMEGWVEKMKPMLTYMSNIISTVKGQTVNLSESTNNEFTIGELMNRINFLMGHELKMKNCKLNTHSELKSDTVIKGEINNILQILNSMILNAIDSYEGNSGEVDLSIYKKDQNVLFAIRDYGKGIDEKVKQKLFKQMITTKGKNGTGLGLYMSYSAVKGRLGGDMWFESLAGKGSTFYISIPA